MKAKIKATNKIFDVLCIERTKFGILYDLRCGMETINFHESKVEIIQEQ